MLTGLLVDDRCRTTRGGGLRIIVPYAELNSCTLPSTIGRDNKTNQPNQEDLDERT